ncbi:MAG: hypothetical protein WC887_01360 [Candidatus Paceibacterota bacterium]|jgi:hypothetical protein
MDKGIAVLLSACSSLWFFWIVAPILLILGESILSLFSKSRMKRLLFFYVMMLVSIIAGALTVRLAEIFGDTDPHMLGMGAGMFVGAIAGIYGASKLINEILSFEMEALILFVGTLAGANVGMASGYLEQIEVVFYSGFIVTIEAVYFVCFSLFNIIILFCNEWGRMKAEIDSGKFET